MPDAPQQGKYISYEELDDGAIVRILLNRPETRNAQNRGLLVELDEAFLRAEEDDQVRVVILGGVGPALLLGPRHGVQGGSCRADARARPAPVDHHQRRHPRGRRAPDAPGVALLLPEHPAVAEPPQDHRRPGPGDGVRRRPDAHVGLRPHRGRRQRVLRRRGRHPARHVRRRVLRPPVGVRPPADQGAHAHRRRHRRPRGPPARHGHQGLPGGRAAASARWTSPGASPSCRR